MIEIRKSVLVPYSADNMFNLVMDIDNYPQYLPWCNKSSVITKTDNSLVGTIGIEYLKINTHFTTKNTYEPYNKIQMQLIDGPFKELSGLWYFVPIGNNGCKIEFLLRYKFANLIIEKVIGPVFNIISKNIVDCFIKEAKKRYCHNTDEHTKTTLMSNINSVSDNNADNE